MSKFRLTTRLGYEQMAEHIFAETYKFHQKQYNLGPFLGPWEMKCQLKPGHQRRQDRKDAIRRADYRNVMNIVGKIFTKKKLKLPPNNVRDLGWIKKTDERDR